MAKGIAQEIAGYRVIEGRSIDSYGFKQVDYLKLDIEGMEITALKGASDTIDRCRPVMHIEHYKANQEELKEYIYSKNYHIVDEDSWYDYTCIPKT
jgi:hypothetical protein